ncbi:hypothetical protein C8R47DRAFT_1208170 [Mycena vitilis]|nr:hypothetical protein C8R47DRAFT_1208170 [Mycena vitilis]
MALPQNSASTTGDSNHPPSVYYNGGEAILPTSSIHRSRTPSPVIVLNLPNELLLDIFARLPRKDVVSLLRTNSIIHLLAARLIYTNVRVIGLAARRLFSTLATKSLHSSAYSASMRRLRYTFTSTSETFLTFPVLCQALLTMNHLVSLSLDIYPAQADALMLSLHRYGLLRTRVLVGTRLLASSQGHTPTPLERALPSLRGLRLRGGTAAAGALLCHREVEELVISTPLDYSTLSDLCSLIDRSVYGNRITTLIVRLANPLKVEDVLTALAEVMPNLEQLSLDQPRLRPMNALTALIGQNALFKRLRRLSLNVASPWLEIDPANMSLWLSERVERLSRLVAFSIGSTDRVRRKLYLSPKVIGAEAGRERGAGRRAAGQERADGDPAARQQRTSRAPRQEILDVSQTRREVYVERVKHELAEEERGLLDGMAKAH